MHREDTDSFCRSFERLTEQAEYVANSFEAVRSELCGISGGVGCLQGALDELDARIKEENTVFGNLQQLNQEAEDFVDSVLDTDRNVARIIHKEKDKFYQVNPWAIPPEPETDDRNIFERGLDALCDLGEAIIDGAEALFNAGLDYVRDLGSAFFDLCREGIEVIRDIGHWAIESFVEGCRNAWDWIVEHRRAIAEIVIGAVVIAGLAVLTICTCGVASAIFAGALIGAVAFGAIGAVTGGISAAAQGEDIFDGVAKGFMGGTISGAVSGAVFVATEGAALNPFVSGGISAGCSFVTETIHAVLDDGRIDSNEARDIGAATLISGVTGTVFSGLGDVFNKIPGASQWFSNIWANSINQHVAPEFAKELLSGSSEYFIGKLFGETLSEGFGNIVGDLIDVVAGGPIREGVGFIIEHPESLVIGNIPSLLPPLLPPLQPVSPLVPNFDIDIDIDINIDLDVTFDFRPFCFVPPTFTAPLLGPIVSAVLN